MDLLIVDSIGFGSDSGSGLGSAGARPSSLESPGALGLGLARGMGAHETGEAARGEAAQAAPGGFGAVLSGVMGPVSQTRSVLPRIRQLSQLVRIDQVQPQDAMLLAMSIREIRPDFQLFAKEAGSASFQGVAGAAQRGSGSDNVNPFLQSVSDWWDGVSENGELDGLPGLESGGDWVQALTGAVGLAESAGVFESLGFLPSAERIQEFLSASPIAAVVSTSGIQERIVSLVNHLEKLLAAIQEAAPGTEGAPSDVFSRQVAARLGLDGRSGGVSKLGEWIVLNADGGPRVLGPDAARALAAAGLSRSASGGANQGGDKLLPDLVYLGEARRGNSRSPLSLSGDMRFVSTSAGPEGGDAGALRSLVDKVRSFGAELESSGDRSFMNPTMEHFLAARLNPAQAVSGQGGLERLAAMEVMEPGLSNGSVMIESVRQAQAALADMAERMRGQVTFDSKGMKAVVHLEPPVLGRLHLQIEFDENNRLVAHVSADQAATQEFLKQNQSDLRQGLADQGFDPDEVDFLFEDRQRDSFGRLLTESVNWA